MTDPEWLRELGAIRTELEHIKQFQRDAKDEAAVRAEKYSAFNARLVRLETTGSAMSELPKQVHANEIENAIQNALRDGHQKTVTSTRNWAVVVVTVATGVQMLINFIGGSP